VNIRKVTIKSLREQIAMVTQEKSCFTTRFGTTFAMD